jgi:carbon-monoxide dehydrogenase iron sulfur subunit
MAICSWTHFGENTIKRARINIEADWPKTPVIRVCLACKDHECVAACPHGALTWENWIQLDQNQCDGCAVCVDACPVQGIHLDKQSGFPLICDTCEGQYQCVQWCPTSAIQKRNR